MEKLPCINATIMDPYDPDNVFDALIAVTDKVNEIVDFINDIEYE